MEKYRGLFVNNRVIAYCLISVSVALIFGLALFIGIGARNISDNNIHEQITDKTYKFKDALQIANSATVKRELFYFYSPNCEECSKQASVLLGLDRVGKIKLIPINIQSEPESWNLFLGGLTMSERNIVKDVGEKPALMYFIKRQPKSHVGYLSESNIVNEFIKEGDN